MIARLGLQRQKGFEALLLESELDVYCTTVVANSVPIERESCSAEDEKGEMLCGWHVTVHEMHEVCAFVCCFWFVRCKEFCELWVRACLDMVWLRILTFDVCWHPCCHVCSFGGSEFGVHAWLDGDCVKRRLVCFFGCALTRISSLPRQFCNFPLCQNEWWWQYIALSL